MASLMPLQKSICPWKSPPQLHPFIQQDFMKTLEKAGPQLTSRLKGDWIGLYRWSPNLSHCSHSKDQGSATKAIKIAEDDRKEKVNQRAATGSATKEPGSAAKEPCPLPSAYSFGTLVDEAFKQQLERWC